MTTVRDQLFDAIKTIVQVEIDTITESDWWTEELDKAVERAFEKRRTEPVHDVYYPPQNYKDEDK